MGIDPASGLPVPFDITSRPFVDAYLRHLHASQELLSFRLNSLHNLTYFLDLARNARRSILEGRYADFLAGVEALYPEEAARAAAGA